MYNITYMDLFIPNVFILILFVFGVFNSALDYVLYMTAYLGIMLIIDWLVERKHK